jgi:sigma-B regulation protein RsbU (phosphoserine phosphatase)
VSEAFNPSDEEYGEARLSSFLMRNASLPAPELIRRIVDDGLGFCGSAWPKDDITLMAVSRRE